MQALEAKAKALAEQARDEQAQPKSKVLFVRGDNQEEAAEAVREDNPDEIVLGEDDDSDDEQVQVEGQKKFMEVFSAEFLDVLPGVGASLPKKKAEFLDILPGVGASLPTKKKDIFVWN